MKIKPIFFAYLLIAAASILLLILGINAFLNLDRYRSGQAIYSNQDYQVRLHFSNAIKHLELGKTYFQWEKEHAEENKPNDYDNSLRQLFFAYAILQDIPSLPYIKNFLSEESIQTLHEMTTLLDKKIIANIQNESPNVLLQNLEKIISHVSTIGYDRRIVAEAKHVTNVAAYKNNLIVSTALMLMLMLIVILILVQRSRLAYERKEFFQNFFQLFSHATRARLGFLDIFLKQIQEFPKFLTKERVEEASNTLQEIQSINQDLLDFTSHEEQHRLEPLGTLIQETIKDKDFIKLEMSPATGQKLVNAAYIDLILKELMQNALDAVKDCTQPEITIRAQFKKRCFFFPERLLLEISDNGIGMTTDVLKHAQTPLFSTKGGTHMGLGLSVCSRLVASLHGKLTIKSSAQHGTTVSIMIDPILK